MEELEKRVAAKKALKNENSRDNQEPSSSSQIDNLDEAFSNKLVLSKTDDRVLKPSQPERPAGASLAVNYIIIMAFFSMLNQIYYKMLKKS